MITVMAALESMAARLAAERATDADIADLRGLMDDFRDGGNDGGSGSTSIPMRTSPFTRRSSG